MSHGGASENSPTPAIQRLDVGPYQWGTECLSGDVNAGPATSFPMSINMASAFDVDLLRRTASATGLEVRAKNNDASQRGIHSFHTGLSCWSPVINIARHPLWGRLQETYGEDPFLNGEMAAAFVAGLQGNSSRYLLANAGCKHFAGFAGPGNSNGDHAISERDLQTTFLPQFKRCVDAGAWSFMCSYSAINGVPACGSEQLLTDILRREWKFPGYVVSDQTALTQIAGTYSPRQWHDQPSGYAPFNASVPIAAAKIAAAGCDLEDSNWNTTAAIGKPGNIFAALPAAVSQGLIAEAQLNVAVKRLFNVRFRLGEFDPPAMTKAYTDIGLDVVQSAAHRTLAEEATRKSLVLLKNAPRPSTNAPTLPLSAARLRGKTIAVVGPFVDGFVSGKTDYPPRGAMYYGDYGAGGFKAYWKTRDPWPNAPTARNFTVTVREALATRAAAASATIRATAGCTTSATTFGQPPDVCNEASYDSAAVTSAASQADIAIICLGTSKFVEAEGVDRTSLALPGAQVKLLRDAAQAVGPEGVVIVLLFNAGGLDVNWAASSDSVHAIIAAGFPGQTTGTGIMQVLFGEEVPAGRLAVTWPKSLEQVGSIGNYSMSGSTFRYAQPDPLYPFGFGLSYTTFAYSSLSVRPSSPRACESVTVRTKLANTGAMDADEVVLVFVEWAQSPHPTPSRSLAAFQRVRVAAGSSREVSLEIPPARLAVLAIPGLNNTSSTWIASPVSMRIFIGGQQPNMAARAPSNVLSASFEVVGPATPLSQC